MKLPRFTSFNRLLSAVFLIALIVRAAYFIDIRTNPFFNYPILDASKYVNQGLAIANGDFAGRGIEFDNGKPYSQGVGYPFFLAIPIALFGVKYGLLRALGLLLGTINCVLIAALGRRAFGERAGAIAGLMAAFCGPFIFFEGELLAVTLLITLILSSLMMALRAGDSLLKWAFAGILAGAAAVTWPAALVVMPVIALWALFGRNPAAPEKLKGRSWKAALVLCAATFIPILPVTIRNAVIGHDRVLIAYGSGPSFFIGNTPEFDKLIRIRPGADWNRFILAPERQGITGSSEKSAWFTRQAVRAISDNPFAWAALMLRKTAMFFNGHEISRNQDMYYFRQFTRLLSLLMWEKTISFPMGLIWPLALLGAGLAFIGPKRAGDDRDTLTLITLFALVYSASVILFFVVSRYRLPIAPVLIILAAYSVVRGYDAIKGKQWKSVALAVCVLVPLLALCNCSRFRLNPISPAENDYNMARILYDHGKYDDSLPLYMRALSVEPNNTSVLNDLGNIAVAKRRIDEALDYYTRATKADPADAMSHANRGAALAMLGRYDEAAAEYQHANTILPNWDVPRKALESIRSFIQKK